MVKAIITLMCRLQSNLRWGNRPHVSIDLPFVLSVNRMQSWLRYWAVILQGMKEDPGQVPVAVADNWEVPLLSSHPLFSLCSVFTAANLFNLGSEADEFMRMERCWMKPPGHYWWQPSHTLLMQGHQIDSPDAHSCTSRCCHCDCVSVWSLYAGLYLPVWTAERPLSVYSGCSNQTILENCCSFQIQFEYFPDPNLVKQDPKMCLLIEFKICCLSVSLVHLFILPILLFMSPVLPRLWLPFWITLVEFMTIAWWFHCQNPRGNLFFLNLV